nr:MULTISPECIES: hypothetical protein [unclassified Massilia]
MLLRLATERQQVARIAHRQQLAHGGGRLFDGGARGIDLQRQHPAGAVERLFAETAHQLESMVELGLSCCEELFWK